ncbi:MAG: hypothetical protein ABW321_05990 [Polyangiales bacterium]
MLDASDRDIPRVIAASVISARADASCRSRPRLPDHTRRGSGLRG